MKKVYRALVSGVASFAFLLGLGVVAHPAGAASYPYRCNWVRKDTNFRAAGLSLTLTAYAQYNLSATEGYTYRSVPVLNLKSTTGTTYKKQGVLYFQMDNANKPWTNAKKVNYVAGKKVSYPLPQNSVKGAYTLYGRKVRYIFNARDHNFVTPWVTIGTGNSC